MGIDGRSNLTEKIGPGGAREEFASQHIADSPLHQNSINDFQCSSIILGSSQIGDPWPSLKTGANLPGRLGLCSETAVRVRLMLHDDGDSNEVNVQVDGYQATIAKSSLSRPYHASERITAS